MSDHDPFDTLASARAVMCELRVGIERARFALRAAGYQFVADPDAVIAEPPAARLRSLDALEARAGALPVAVRAFYEVLGAVDFRGTHPSWPRTGSVALGPEPCWETDPLVVVALERAMEDPSAEAWSPSEGPLVLRIVPDAASKAGYSAGPGYGVACGGSDGDPALLDDPLHDTFVGHLRRALAWGGLPGFARIPECAP